MLLSEGDYQSLKKSVKGWTARKLRGYGIAWPPVKGWRKRLIRQYEGSHRRVAEPTDKRIPRVDREQRTNKQRFYVNGALMKVRYMTRAQLDREGVAERERKATHEWYVRMSGQVPWMPGERDSFLERFESFSIEMDALNRQIASEAFAALPDC